MMAPEAPRKPGWLGIVLGMLAASVLLPIGVVLFPFGVGIPIFALGISLLMPDV